MARNDDVKIEDMFVGDSPDNKDAHYRLIELVMKELHSKDCYPPRLMHALSSLLSLVALHSGMHDPADFGEAVVHTFINAKENSKVQVATASGDGEYNLVMAKNDEDGKKKLRQEARRILREKGKSVDVEAVERALGISLDDEDKVEEEPTDKTYH